MKMREYHHRRTCVSCDRSYQHDPITATGVDLAGDRLHLIACSWTCVVNQITERHLDAGVLPAGTLYVH